MSRARRVLLVVCAVACAALPLAGQTAAPLPPGLEPQTRRAIELLADSLRGAGLPYEPILAKAAEGQLKHATDAQILTAVRGLARRFGEIRSALGVSLGVSLDESAMSAAATALLSGVPMPAIQSLRVAAGTSRDADVDFTTALITLTDLVEQRVPPGSAATAVQSLLARRAALDQYARLRVDVRDEIARGRSPEQAAQAQADAIVKNLPASPPSIPIKPPGHAW